MTSRAEQKQRLREQRKAEERVATAEQRKRTAYLAGGIALLAIIIVGALILVSQSGDDSSSNPPVESGLLAGIPQSGITLGQSDAPVTVVEFADLQCPFCAMFATENFPDVVKKYVEPGDVKMELRLLGFVGPDSENARLVAGAAAEQDRIWPLAENVYQNQGQENSGYLTNDFLKQQGADIPGLDIDKAIADSSGDAAQMYASESDTEAQNAQVSSTPTFLVGPTGGQMNSVSADGLDKAIDEALAQAKA